MEVEPRLPLQFAQSRVPAEARRGEKEPERRMSTHQVDGRASSPAKQAANLKSLSSKIIASLIIIMHLKVHLCAGVAADESPASIQRHRQQVEFAEPESDNNTQKVAAGRPVRFKCVVNNIGDHKVAWFHKDRHVLLALDNKTLAWPERIQVSSQADSVFVLQINSVQLSDKGHYICQLNTQPPKSQAHILDVVKSPQIREQETTINIEPVKEFSSVELRCVAEGIPEPVIKWRRESHTFELPIYDEPEPESNELDGDVRAAERRRDDEMKTGDRLQAAGSGSPPSSQMAPLVGQNASTPAPATATSTPAPGAQTLTSSARLFIAEGEVLRIDRVSRYDMGYYMCIASNGVPPSVSQRIFLPVSYVAPPRNASQAAHRLKENNARPAPGDRSAKVRGEGAGQAERAPAGRAEPTAWVGSGRSYQRHRQLKAARSSAAAAGSSAAHSSRAPSAALFTLALALVIYICASQAALDARRWSAVKTTSRKQQTRRAAAATPPSRKTLA